MSASEKVSSATLQVKDRLLNPRSAYDWSRISDELDDMGLSATAFRVFCNPLRRSDKRSHTCYPGTRRIAHDCRLNRETVIEVLRELEECGMLKIERGWGKRSDYEILPLSSWKLAPKTDQPEIGTGRKEEPVGNRDRNHNHSSLNPIQETTTTTTRACAHAKAADLVAEAPSSLSLAVVGVAEEPAKAALPVTEASSLSFPSAVAVSEEPSGELSPQDRAELDQIALEFGSDSRQKAKAVACTKRRGDGVCSRTSLNRPVEPQDRELGRCV